MNLLTHITAIKQFVLSNFYILDLRMHFLSLSLNLYLSVNCSPYFYIHTVLVFIALHFIRLCTENLCQISSVIFIWIVHILRTFRAVNAIFGKVLRIATEDTILHLIFTKCMHADTAVRARCLSSHCCRHAFTRSLDFIQTRLLVKLFKTSSLDIIRECCAIFNIKSVSNLILHRKRNILTKFVEIDYNLICSAIYNIARSEII